MGGFAMGFLNVSAQASILVALKYARFVN